MLNFLYDDDKDVENLLFKYYRYIGSNTQPPCAEFVYWIIIDEELSLSSSIIGMFKDSLNDPKTPDVIADGNQRTM